MTASATGAPSPTGPASPPIPAGNHVVEVSSTDGRACAIFSNGMLQCWGGSNSYGELGQGHRHKPVTPNWVKGIQGVKKVALSRFSTCAILRSGELYCWGGINVDDVAVVRPADVMKTLKDDSDLWDSSRKKADPPSKTMTPLRVPDLANVVDVAVSERHRCAVDNSGTLYCWGENTDGQLGLGVAAVGKTFKNPTPVPGIVDAVGVAVSDAISIAWTKGGDLYQWGSPNSRADPAPRKIAILSGVKRAKIHMNQVCASLANGEVRCFTHETFQDFLIGKEHDFGPALAAFASVVTEKEVAPIANKFVFPDGRGLANVIDFVVFNDNASAVTDKGEVYSWGSAERGTVGHPEKTKGFFPPMRIQGFTHAVAIVGSFRHRCALEKNGEVRCFGNHNYLGIDTPNNSTSAVVVKGLPKIIHLASTEDCTIALAEDRSLWAWGGNQDNTCGWAESKEDGLVPAPVAIVKTPPSMAPTTRENAAGNH